MRFKKHRDLYKISWTGDAPCRVFFCYGRGHGVLLLLCGCRGKPPKPRDAYKTAEKRRQEIEEGTANVNEFLLGKVA